MKRVVATKQTTGTLFVRAEAANWVKTKHHDLVGGFGLLAALIPFKFWFNQSSHKAETPSGISAECVIGLLLSATNVSFQ